MLLLVFLFSPGGLPARASEPLILVTYYSQTGNTRLMAEAVQEGALRVIGVRVVLKEVGETTALDLMDADAIVVGSPVYNANVAPGVSAFIASWPFEGEPLKDKLGAAFVTAGGLSAGEEITQMNILQSMLIFGMIVIGGPDWTMPFGASAIRGEEVFPAEAPIHPHFLEKGKSLGQRVAETALKLNREYIERPDRESGPKD